jgi:hypothetical protein
MKVMVSPPGHGVEGLFHPRFLDTKHGAVKEQEA